MFRWVTRWFSGNRSPAPVTTRGPPVTAARLPVTDEVTDRQLSVTRERNQRVGSVRDHARWLLEDLREGSGNQAIIKPARHLQLLYEGLCDDEDGLGLGRPYAWKRVAGELKTLGCVSCRRKLHGKTVACWLIPPVKTESVSREKPNVFEFPRLKRALGKMAGNMRSQDVTSSFVASAC